MSELPPLALSGPELGPFWGPQHAALRERLRALPDALDWADHDPLKVGRALGAELGLYRWLVPEYWGGAPMGRPDDPAYIDVRALCLIREALAWLSPMADSIFAVQGLGSFPLVLAGSEAQRARLLPQVMAGARLCAFGLTEPEAGSDVASLTTRATPLAGGGYRLDGAKTLISNVGIAGHTIVFARIGDAPGHRAISALLVEEDTRQPGPGLHAEPLPMSAPHPLGALRFDGLELPQEALLGPAGKGFGLAMRTLDTFRISVAAAANGMAARALAETLGHVSRRVQFGQPLAAQQLVQGYLATMQTELDAARLLTARAAWARDDAAGADPRALRALSRPAAEAKWFATEAAHRTIDTAVQLHGGRGVLAGSVVEALYREIRPLRIYEGASEVQQVIIAQSLLRS